MVVFTGDRILGFRVSGGGAGGGGGKGGVWGALLLASGKAV